MPKGGARAGAGRKPKPTSEVRVTRAFRLDQTTVARLETLAAERGVPASHVIDQLVRDA